MFFPFCVTPFLVTLPYSPLFHHTPRLAHPIDCVTVFFFAEPYIIVCVALLYHVLLFFSFSVNYCILHITWLIPNSGDYYIVYSLSIGMTRQIDSKPAVKL